MPPANAASVNFKLTLRCGMQFSLVANPGRERQQNNVYCLQKIATGTAIIFLSILACFVSLAMATGPSDPS